jgi:nitrogen-specific signal transduction histidine kinase
MEKSKDKAAAFVGSQGLIFDITRYKQAEKERLEIQRRLLEMQKMDALGRLAEGIAHDFNNKLGTILGCAEMIKQGNSSEMDIYINPIISASKHAADLTGKLLLFARNSNPQVEDVNINALVLNVVHLLEHTVDKRISIHHSFHPQTPAVHGDVKQIQSAILNIAMNACEALPEGGKLLFETSVSACDAAFRKRMPVPRTRQTSFAFRWSTRARAWTRKPGPGCLNRSLPPRPTDPPSAWGSRAFPIVSRITAGSWKWKVRRARERG